MTTSKTYRMKTVIQIGFIVVFALSGCQYPTQDGGIPTNMRPVWKEIPVEDLPVKFGQLIAFKDDNIKLSALVLDFDEDEGGIWIGLCLIHEDSLFGRQIPSGLTGNNCLDLMDLSYLHLSGMKNFKILKQLNINKTQVGLGAISPVRNLIELERDYRSGISRRGMEQTPCDKKLTGANPVYECYFEVSTIK